MRIGVDVMGGDNAPDEILKGAYAALSKLPSEDTLVLFGNGDIIEESIRDRSLSKKRLAYTRDSVHFQYSCCTVPGHWRSAVSDGDSDQQQKQCFRRALRIVGSVPASCYALPSMRLQRPWWSFPARMA